MRRLMGLLRRNGTLAVFLIRKIPLPFVLVNIMLGASACRVSRVLDRHCARHDGHGRRVGRLRISTRRDVATPFDGERHPRSLVSLHSVESGLDDQSAPACEERRCLECLIRHPTRRRPARRRSFSPDDNCWRIDRADRFSCVQDAADYFRLVRHAFLHARETIFILGWDIQSTLDLVPGGASDGAPTRLDELLKWVIRRRPQLTCHVLTWDYAELYALEREPLATWRWVWQMPRQVRFAFDDRHPIGGSHHQKIVVVDDVLAFCGGIDLTGHRWDTAAHRVEEPLRVNATGSPYDAVPRGTGDGVRTGGRKSRHARSSSMAGAGRNAAAGCARLTWRLVARCRRAGPDRYRRRHCAHRPAVRERASNPRMRAAVRRLDCRGAAVDLHRKPVFHQRCARTCARGAAAGARGPRDPRGDPEGVSRVGGAADDGRAAR